MEPDVLGTVKEQAAAVASRLWLPGGRPEADSVLKRCTDALLLTASGSTQGRRPGRKWMCAPFSGGRATRHRGRDAGCVTCFLRAHEQDQATAVRSGVWWCL